MPVLYSKSRPLCGFHLEWEVSITIGDTDFQQDTDWAGFLISQSSLGNSALDRLANASYQIVIEGSSYRERQSPHRALLEAKGVIDRPTVT